jgi:predicted AAA+ superfamily ATPase
MIIYLSFHKLQEISILSFIDNSTTASYKCQPCGLKGKLAIRLVNYQKIPALVVTGARQTGKTSLLRKVFPGHAYVSLDAIEVADLAEKNTREFLGRFPPPVVIDEVLYAPGLFRNLKIAIDRDRHRMGPFILTGAIARSETACHSSRPSYAIYGSLFHTIERS